MMAADHGHGSGLMSRINGVTQNHHAHDILHSVTLPTKHLGRVEIIHAVENLSGRSEARETLIVRDAVTAEFSVKADSLRSPAKVGFTPRSHAGIVTREWVFGDGQGSTEESPVHAYTAPGEYRPTLKVRDVTGREHSWQLSESITVAPPRPWWLPWSICAGAFLALAAVITLIVRDRSRLLDLDGRLEWQFGSNRGRVELAGRQFDFNSLNIPGWKPVGLYTLIRRKAAGYQLMRDGIVEQGVEEDTSLEAEGVRLRLVP